MEIDDATQHPQDSPLWMGMGLAGGNGGGYEMDLDRNYAVIENTDQLYRVMKKPYRKSTPCRMLCEMLVFRQAR